MEPLNNICPRVQVPNSTYCGRKVVPMYAHIYIYIYIEVCIYIYIHCVYIYIHAMWFMDT